MPSLPPELLDLIVDHSSHLPASLKTCCLVSKSWVPRARRHLFAHVEFDSEDYFAGCSIESWIKAFPDPSNSPAHHARGLAISGLTAVKAATTHGHAWIRSFNSIIKLAVDTHWWDDGDLSLVQLHGLSPTLKSLSLDRSSLPLSEAFNLACSFPLLEDLSLRSFRPQQPVHDPINPPSTSPKLTGTLLLQGDIRSLASRLLDLPGGLHFAKISIDCHGSCLNSAVDLVSRCSDTLESLYFSSSTSLRPLLLISTSPLTVRPGPPRMSPPFDLSKVIKLKDVEFRWWRPDIQWINMSLQTIKSSNLRQITITIGSFVHPSREAVCQQWRDLDHLLVQLWTSRSILPKIMYGRSGSERGDNLRDIAPSLLPELTSRGAVSVVM